MRSNRGFAISVALVLILIGGGAFAGYRYYHGQVYDQRRLGQRPVSIDIPAGAGVSGVGDVLARNGVISSTLVFEIYVRTHGFADKLQAGHYTLSGSLSLPQVLSVIAHAQGVQVTVTIPEGFTSKQIAALIEAKGLFSAAAYLDAVNNGVFAQPFLAGRTPGYGVEGYLFPDTYFFDPKASPASVVNEQLNHFGQVVPLDLRSRAANQQVTFAQAMVMASIIEREAQFDKDRPYVAAVFYNRLAQGQPLQSDATVAYAKGQSTVITEQDKALNSPFNTYLHTGLPPAPISNPGPGVDPRRPDARVGVRLPLLPDRLHRPRPLQQDAGATQPVPGQPQRLPHGSLTAMRVLLLGHPVAHSVSPAVQNAAFMARDLPHRYEAVDVEPRPRWRMPCWTCAPTIAWAPTSPCPTSSWSPRTWTRSTPTQRCWGR